MQVALKWQPYLDAACRLQDKTEQWMFYKIHYIYLRKNHDHN